MEPFYRLKQLGLGGQDRLRSLALLRRLLRFLFHSRQGFLRLLTELLRGLDKLREKRMGRQRFREKFRMELTAEEPGMIGQLDHFHELHPGRVSELSADQ